jgi:hypothetical protein
VCINSVSQAHEIRDKIVGRHSVVHVSSYHYKLVRTHLAIGICLWQQQNLAKRTLAAAAAINLYAGSQVMQWDVGRIILT